MTKRFFLFVVVLAISLAMNAQSVIAQSDIPPCKVSPCFYVDRNKSDANEDGSQSHPYNTENEGRALAQSQSHGGYIYVKDPGGTTWREVYVPRATPGPLGAPLPEVLRYVVLAVIAMILILAGWWLMRRSRQMQV